MVNRTRLTVLWCLLVAQRLYELRLAKDNSNALRARGAQEFGADHYPLMVLLHTGWFICWFIESWQGGCPLNPYWKLLLSVALVGQFLRWTSIRTLGERWTTRVLVLPETPPVGRGFYRLIPHPNYLGVVLELLSIPLLFGAWRTAIVFSLANLWLLRRRIEVEDKALGRR